MIDFDDPLDVKDFHFFANRKSVFENKTCPGHHIADKWPGGETEACAKQTDHPDQRGCLNELAETEQHGDGKEGYCDDALYQTVKRLLSLRSGPVACQSSQADNSP